MVRTLLLSFFLLLGAGALFSQTTLGGKITDEETGEPIIFGTVAIFKNGVLITGTDTDMEGNYNLPDIDPGTYDVEASYVGYKSQRIVGVKVLAGKATRLDIKMTSDGGVVLDEITIVEYKVPLIEQDNTTSGAVITSDQIRNLPTRNINALAATSAGLATADEGGAINVRGSRSNATDYYVDGIRIQGNLIPESEIEQLQVITGGIEAQYGDVTGGIISITTKGPSNNFSGGLEVESSGLTDPYNNSLLGVNLTGPILKNKVGQSILGYRFSGRYTYQLDDDPPATNVFQVKPDKLAELEANPVLPSGRSFLVAADFLGEDDVNVLKARPNEAFERLDLTANLSARLSDAIDIAFTGALTDTKNQFTPGGWRVLNSQNNPFSYGNTYRGNLRFRHRLGGSASESGGRSVIQNASYTLQAGYEKTQGETYDQRHGFNYFDYGYVGKFDVEWVPTFALAFDEATQSVRLQHTDYRQVLRGYEGAAINPVLANYNKALGLTPGEGINSQVGEFIVTNFFDDRSLLALGSFIAPNGFISPVYNNSWGFHTNVGWVYNSASRSDNDLYTMTARANFDLVPTSSDKGRHNIQLGFIYEQRTNRGYTVSPRGLWDIARQQANNHIQGIVPGADTIGYIDIPNFPQTPILGLSIAQNADNRFYRAIREELNLPLTAYVNVDGLDPTQLRLDMFSAKELNDQGALGYFGYDYLGNPFDGTFDEFFTATDADGVRTFPVTPNRPVYSAFYLQDKFTFRDIIFRLGVRVDRYDANTRVLKDPYSLYEIIGADEYHSLPDVSAERPGNIGDDFKVYLNDAGNSVQAYRDGDQWYRANGTPVNSPIEIFSGGLVFPRYKDSRAQSINNYIKSRDFDPNASFRDYQVQVNIMPRLAFSFPISEDANFFAHYDILVQRPPSNTLATPLDYFYFTDFPGVIKNNPDLRPERTIDYEVGFQQKLSASSKIKIAAYYKELRDMIQVRTFFPVPIINQYTTYDNLDFGTVKGFSFEYELRRTGNVSLVTNYTLQFADGTGSDANSQRGLTSRGNLRTLFPLNFDERHRININLDYRYGAGKFYNGPRIGGVDLLSNTGLSLQAVAVSGRPYTGTLTPLELGGAQIAGAINGARKPWNFTINLRVDKNFTFGNGLGGNIYCRISNLLDRRNIINVYSATGSPYDDGFLASSNGQDKLQNIVNSNREVEAYLASFQWALLNPNFFSLPRRIFLGAILDF
ncbi:MAG: carboxypeptidase regulatory-like domain-containing protein [Lewinellaceae bacterium]|nr:carboxypeptidase regulatory-like domain-containing protein [Lewinellaceae bacterium]